MRTLALGGPLAASVLLVQAAPVFRAEIGVVVLQATVRNGRGQQVTGLDRAAFTVYENGDRQAITIFRHGEVPIALGILLDNSRSMRGKREAAEAAALSVLRASRPQDLTFVMNFAEKARVDVALTSDVGALAAGVSRRDSIGGTALWDAIAQAQDHLVERAGRQRRILVITDGTDNASNIPRERLKRQTAENDVAVFAIVMASPDDPKSARRGRDALEDVAEASGGVAQQVGTVAEADARGSEMAQQMRQFYAIGYSPIAQALDGTFRKVRLVAKGQERLRVRTRAGYRATRARTHKQG